ncbi:MAG: hypothetical protein SCH71_12595 [Desulfobulbaceae bacterium]|nr:hypothetical protein [Desulfobulbaceae bacterium]
MKTICKINSIFYFVFTFIVFWVQFSFAFEITNRTTEYFGNTVITWDSEINMKSLPSCEKSKATIEWEAEGASVSFNSLEIKGFTPKDKNDPVVARIYDARENLSEPEKGSIELEIKFINLFLDKKTNTKVGNALVFLIVDVDVDNDGVPETQEKLGINLHTEIPFSAGNDIPPSIFDITVEDTSFPIPLEKNYYVFEDIISFKNPSREMININLALNGPEGNVRYETIEVCVPDEEGVLVDEFMIDSSFVKGKYELIVEIIDQLGQSSGKESAFFTLAEDTPAPLDITGIEPQQGNADDIVIIRGVGFGKDSGLINVNFSGTFLSADIITIDSEKIKVRVPDGAITGPVRLETNKGTAYSLIDFHIDPQISLTPKRVSLLPGRSYPFSCRLSGMEDKNITFAITPEHDYLPSGEIDLLGRYTSPENISEPHQVKVRCESVAMPSLFAESILEIILPQPDLREKIIDPSLGGTVSSEFGEVIIEIPPGAVNDEIEISIEALKPSYLPRPVPDQVNLAAVKLGPSGTQFEKPVKVHFALKHWIDPETELPLYLLDENSGIPIDTGKKALVDESGIYAQAQIDHFSTYLCTSNPSIRASGKGMPAIFSSYADLFADFDITLPPDMELLEGLSVPILVLRPEGELQAIGPFALGINVTPVLAGYTRETTPLTAGPLVRTSPTGWQLGTTINIPTLPDCNGGESRQVRLLIDYENVGDSNVTMELPFKVQCLDELEFGVDNPPDNLPPYAKYSSLHNSVTLETGHTYRFSEARVGEGAKIRINGKPNNAEPAIVEVTGDFDLYGTIEANGSYGFSGKNGRGADDSGLGGSAYLRNAGSGGRGGQFTIYEPYTIYTALGPYTFSNRTSNNGQVGRSGNPGGLGGRGGISWEEGSILGVIEDSLKVVWDGASIVATAGANYMAYVDLIRHTYSLANEVIKINDNDENKIKAAGMGGKRSSVILDPELPYFRPSTGGGGGGGSGKTFIRWSSDRSGGGGGGGGSGAPSLQLVVDDYFVIHESGFIDGRGGYGGAGGTGAGDSDKAVPAGGGAGGNGAQIHIATSILTNNGIIDISAGPGGLAGWLEDEDGRRILLPHGFGQFGNGGVIRVDGQFRGATPLGEESSSWQGPYGFLSKYIYRLQLGYHNMRYEKNYYNIFLGDKLGSIEPEGYYYLETFESINGSDFNLRGPGYTQKSSLSVLLGTRYEGLYAYSFKVNWEYNQITNTGAPMAEIHPWFRSYRFYYSSTTDYDRDGLSLRIENLYGTNDWDDDTDNDGYSDYEEIIIRGSDPLIPDRFQIKISINCDRYHDSHGGKVVSPDIDLSSTRYIESNSNIVLEAIADDGFFFLDWQGDIISSEETVSINVADHLVIYANFAHDNDNDGLSNSDELNIYGTDPNNPDTDGDQILDGDEVNIYGLNPRNRDSDIDGLDDWQEIFVYFSDPLNSDTDSDSLKDGHEVSIGTDPNLSDTDRDGLEDSEEVEYGTDPLKADTDEDGFTDYDEITQCTDPLNPGNYPGAELYTALDLPEPEVGAQFGYSVQMIPDITGDGKDEILVGAPFKDVSGFVDVGQVYLFSGTGTLINTINHPSPQEGARFGHSLSYVGYDVGSILIGAPYQDVSMENKGSSDTGTEVLVNDAGMVFSFSSDGQLQNTYIGSNFTDGRNSEQPPLFGWSIDAVKYSTSWAQATGRDKLLVGEPGGGYDGRGLAYLIDWDESSYITVLEIPSPEINWAGNFGYEVDVSFSNESCTLRIGAPSINSLYESYAFHVTTPYTDYDPLQGGGCDFNSTDTVVSSYRNDQPYSNYGKAIRGYGSHKAFIGAPQYQSDFQSEGVVYENGAPFRNIFPESSAEFGDELAKLSLPEKQLSCPAFFNGGINLPEETIAIGSPAFAGNVYITHAYDIKSSDGNTSIPAKIFAQIPNPSGQIDVGFGSSLSGSPWSHSGQLIVGAPKEYVAFEDQGRVYIFNLKDLDTDGDGLFNTFEDSLGSDKCNQDTDGDHFTDGLEYFLNYDFLDPELQNIELENGWIKVQDICLFYIPPA